MIRVPLTSKQREKEFWDMNDHMHKEGTEQGNPQGIDAFLEKYNIKGVL